MKSGILELIEPYRSVSIIGMCKNAGKTTVLNEIIRHWSGIHQTLALTSIGRDGESKDLVTGTKKPGIYVPEGTLIATASDLLLRHCDVTREILNTTGISTPMGDVVIFRARSDGAVQLAGPSMTSQLSRLRDEFFELGADKVLIDGALNRKTLCSRSVSDATILCTGASYHKNLDTVIDDTAFQCRLLTLPETDDTQLRQFALAQADFRGIALFGEDAPFILPAGMNLEEGLRHGNGQTTKTIFFGGALSDFSVKPLLMSGAKLQGLRFVVRDSSKLLLSRDIFEKMLRRGILLQVLDSVNLATVTINPFSAYGFHCSKEELMDRLSAQIHLPVINVMEEAT